MICRERRPDMHTARLDWEKSWAEDIDKNYRTGALARLPSIAAVTPVETISPMALDSALFEIQQETHLICKMQEDLAKEAATCFAESDFQRKWRALSNEKRREFVLEGIYRTMRIPDMEERRKWCPDSTLENLASANGEAYIRMLKTLLPADLSTPITEPTQVPHPIMDRLLSLTPADAGKPGMKTLIRLYSLSRTYCLTTIVWNILLAFHGKSENQFPIKPPRSRIDDLTDGHSQYAGLAADISEQHDKTRKGFSYACWTCGKSAAIFGASVKLMACSKCRKIDRKVWYCSRECQVQDWKNGTPRPHRLICGRVLDEDAIEPVEATEGALDDKGIPEPDPSYKRSPALLHLISLLSQHPELDYVFVRPYPEPDQGVSFADPLGRMFFLILRTRALRNGDPEAVRRMFPMLSHFAQENNIPRSAIQKQMENEFGVPLDDVPWN